MGLYRVITTVSVVSCVAFGSAWAAEEPAPTVCSKQDGWKSGTSAQPKSDCEILPLDISVTDFTSTSGKDFAAALKMFGPKGTGLADQLEKNSLTDDFVHAGDGQLDTVETRKFTAQIRAGYIPEADEASCKGNILFLEGLSDSIQNHLPLFKLLSNEGYRVIAFDYIGQGGSRDASESADDVRIEDLPEMGEKVYKQYATNPRCKKKILLGWSTGGLAAYYWAADRYTDEKSIERQLKAAVESFQKSGKTVTPKLLEMALNKAIDFFIAQAAKALPSPAQALSKLPPGPSVGNNSIDAVILLAPALAVRSIPGEKGIFDFTEITPDLQTPDPEQQKLYVDAPYPPRVIDAPILATDILLNSFLSRAVYYYPVPNNAISVPRTKTTVSLQTVLGSSIRLAAWTVPDRIKGLVFTTSDDDRFINTQALVKEFPTKDDPGMSPKFEWVSVAKDGPKIDPPARHGLDNERPPISDFVKAKILSFLKTI